MKSEDEEFARRRFDQFLRNQNPAADPTWVEVDQKDEPPDYWLLLDGCEYAVEVTGVHTRVKLGNQDKPARQLISSSQRLVKEIEKLARREGALKGWYRVTARPTAAFNPQRIRDGIFQYLAKTRDLAVATREPLTSGSRRTWLIDKVAERPDRVSFVFSGDARGRAQVVSELRTLIAERIADKESKLAQVHAPKILLLTDQHFFSEPSVWREASPAELGSFHTIFRAACDLESYVLASRKAEWVSNPGPGDCA